jgi:ferric-dicitrate binding protein FerR (iron transport regulator)
VGEHNEHISDQLLHKFILRATTPDEETMITQWIYESEENKIYFEQLKDSLKNPTPPAAEPTENDPQYVDLDIVVPKKKASPLRVTVIMITLLATAFILYTVLKGNSNRVKFIQSTQEVLASTLPDQTKVFLNKYSTLSYPTRYMKERIVVLKGEAYFEVPPTEQAITIEAEMAELSTKNASFNVKTFKDSVEIIVVSGSLDVSYQQHKSSLNAHTSLLLAKHLETKTPLPYQDKIYEYYRKDKFECVQTPLYKLVRALSEYYEKDIFLTKAEHWAIPITGSFSKASLDDVLTQLERTYQIEVTHRDHKVIIR